MTSPPFQLEGSKISAQQQHDRPVPSPIRRPRPRSPTTARRLQIKNRRRRYLELHPEYFDSASLELADPLAYDRLVRRFQSTDEREREGRKKGYVGLLEADLWRQEARSASHDAANDGNATENGTGKVQERVEFELEEEESPENKEQGAMRWRSQMEQRFMEGRDADFQYELVDGGDEYDDQALENREEEERWFDQEEATWADDRQEDDRQEDEVGVGHEGHGRGVLSGQTGVQDY